MKRQQALVLLAEKAARKTNNSLSNKKYVVYGAAGSSGLLAEGNSLNTVRSSCINMTQLHGNSVFKIQVQMNGEQLFERTNSTYWKKTDLVCDTAISLVY